MHGLALVLAAQLLWHGLVVAPEDRCAPYSPDDYRYPQSLEARIIERQGGIFSPYTDTRFSDPRETDIEHIVARSEAHDSGLCAAAPATRRAFATDLDNLTLAEPSLNRDEKRGHDAAGWMPERNRCWFVEQVIAVKFKYGLTVDAQEAEALDVALQACQ